MEKIYPRRTEKRSPQKHKYKPVDSLNGSDVLSHDNAIIKIAIIGSRGIPNHYGGFEQCAEYLSLGLKNKGFDVTVYNSHNHPYKESEWNGVRIKHCYDPEFKLGTAGQFIYDLNCILELHKHHYDVILQLGYTSSSVWGWLLPPQSVVTTNMDGLEWMRTKYSPQIRKFLQFAEKLGVRNSDHLISDSIGIQTYLKNKYGADSVYIPYGANVFDDPESAVLNEFALTTYGYDMLIARLEAENSIEIILDGVAKATSDRPFLVIGNHKTEYGKYLVNRYKNYKNIQFLGGIYDVNKLNNLRHFSNVYFHGHTVGGTNPSLLEAMSSSALICAHKNPFNHHILGSDAHYFTNADEVKEVLEYSYKLEEANQEMIVKNRSKIREIYTWDRIVDMYADHIKEIKGVFNR